MRFKLYYYFLVVAISGIVVLASVTTGLAGLAPAGSSSVPSLGELSGVTQHSARTARSHGSPGSLVTMAPQTSLALLSRARKIGAHAPDSTIEITVSLKLRDYAKLESFLEQVQNPHSTLYHRWLTPQEATDRFGPTDEQVEIVKAWLQSRGIDIIGVTSNNLLIQTRAHTAAYERALGIHINDYRLEGRVFYSTADAPKLPRKVSGYVENIVGLDKGRRMKPLSHVSSTYSSLQGVSARAAAPPPQSSGYFLPAQIATAYNVPDITDPVNGQGATIAVLTALSPDLDNSNDSHEFWEALGLPDHQIDVVYVGGTPVAGVGTVETHLDIEWTGVWAPGANLRVYVAADGSLQTFLEMYSQFQEDNLAQVMTISWGITEPGGPIQQSAENIFALAATQGISMFAAAGDDGSSNAGPGDNNCVYPSSSLYIIASSGTELTTDKDGHYLSETASKDTGGAICILDQPGWQRGPGVPHNGRRNTGDMSLNYGLVRPYQIYVTPQQASSGVWTMVGGTSAVSPQLAGLFAVAAARTGERLGQSNKLIYDAVNAGHYDTDFHDITTGNNGAYSAGPGWDHPTGFGSPNARNLIAHLGIVGPKGTIEGIVTAASNPASGLSAASITIIEDAPDPMKYMVSTQSDGSYSQLLPIGTFEVTASAFGYKPATRTVQIADGRVNIQKFSLQAANTVTLHGSVTDGSGHGYPLLASIKVSSGLAGQVAEVWTNPRTGAYSLKLPVGRDYTLLAAAVFPGYSAASIPISLAANATQTTQDIALEVTNACEAPGYYLEGGFTQGFNEASFPPSGWSVRDAISGGGPFNWGSNRTFGDGNWTGGSGDSADANSGATNKQALPYDTSLVTPPIAVSSLNGNSILEYKANYQWIAYRGTDHFYLEINTGPDGDWVPILQWTKSHGAAEDTPGDNVSLDLAPYLPASGTFRLRWRYWGTGWNWYAQVDDVALGERCSPTPGGIVFGGVTDADTGEGILGALVTTDAGSRAESISTEFNPDLPAGFYMLFAENGTRTIKVSRPPYSDMQKEVSVKNNEVGAPVSFKLRHAVVEVIPNSLDIEVPVGGAKTASILVKNTGTGLGVLNIIGINARAPSTSKVFRKKQLRATIIPEKYGHLNFVNLATWQAHKSDSVGGSTKSDWSVFTRASSESAWQSLAAMPQPRVDACAVAALNGKIYVMGGISNLMFAPSGLVYDPTTNTWTNTADLPNGGLEKPVCVAISGKIYVTAGNTVSFNENNTLYIYDPVNDSWTTGADLPATDAQFGASGAAVGGKFYVIGGSNGNGSGAPIARVAAYDPVTDTWTSRKDYPTPITWLGCGAVGGRIVCAGGLLANEVYTGTAATYIYDPSTDTWTKGADMPYDNWGMSVAGSDGQLIVTQGVNVGETSSVHPTNNTAIYTLGTDSWRLGPDSSVATSRGAGACGFYTIGGMDPAGIFAGIDDVEVLPEYGGCDGPGIPWVTLSSTHVTLAPSESTTIEIAIDGTKQTEPAVSDAYLTITGAPKAVLVPLTVHWVHQQEPINLNISGFVTPTGKVASGEQLVYDITVENLSDAEGTATEIALTYESYDDVAYIGAEGASCAEKNMQTVVCDLGSLAPNNSTNLTIVVQAGAATHSVSGTFTVQAREPQQGSGRTSLILETNSGSQHSNDNGGGALGWLALAALLGLGLTAVAGRRRLRRH